MDWDNHFEPLHSTFKIELDTSTPIATYGICFNTLFSDCSVPVELSTTHRVGSLGACRLYL